MTHTKITLTGSGIQQSQNLDISISVVTAVDVDAQTARRQVTAWVASEIGNMLMGGTPQLVISQKTVWRVPILLTSSEDGLLGNVGAIDVDAETGQLLTGKQIRKQILQNVQQLKSTAHSAKS